MNSDSWTPENSGVENFLDIQGFRCLASHCHAAFRRPGLPPDLTDGEMNDYCFFPDKFIIFEAIYLFEIIKFFRFCMELTEYTADSIEHRGIHGTTITKSRSIEKQGFQTPKLQGKKGTGIYFWMGHDDFSCKLAVGWYKQCFGEGRYSKDINQNCAVIFAVFNVNSEQFINISTPVFDKILREYKTRLNIHQTKDIAKLYDKIISKVENETGSRICLYLTQVFAPNRQYINFSSLDRVIGDPYCYIVRDVSIIRITKIEENYDVK